MTTAPPQQKSPPRAATLGALRCSLHGIPDLLQEIRLLLDNRSLHPRTILCLNAHIYRLAESRPALSAGLNAARIVAADGISIVLCSRLFGVPVPARCNMTEAFRAFLLDDSFTPSQALLLGAETAEATAAARTINRMSSHCRVTQAVTGFMADADYRPLLEAHRDADMVLLGMGTPRSELMAATASEICPRAVVWHIGGGTIRFLAGTSREAPACWRRCHLQWLYRLTHEPKRTWRRYIIGIPVFAGQILAEWVRHRRGQA